MDLLQKIRNLPEPVQDYLYGEGLVQANGQVFERNALDFDRQRALLLLLQRILVREVPIADLERTSGEILGGDGEKAKALARDIAGYCLLPLDRWLGDVSGFVRRLGGRLEDYPADRIQIVEKTREEAVADVVKAEEDVTHATDRIKERLEDVLTSFLAGVRTEAQAFETLTRPEKIGGAGLDPEAARRVLEDAKDEAKAVIITSQAVGAPVPAASPALPAPSDVQAPAPPTAPPEDFVTFTPEDEKEIARIKKDVLPAKGADKADETARKLEASIQEIYLASGLKTDDEAMEKRLKTVIGNRLRDVRDQMETLETLVQPKELGGLGLGQDAARALLNAIQARLHEVHETHARQVNAQKAEWVETERAKEAAAPVREADAHKAELEQLFQSIVAKSAKARAKAAEPLPILPKRSVPPPSNLPTTTANPVPPEMRPLVALPAPVPAAIVGGVALPVAPITIVRPAPAASVPEARPKMEDVKAPPKLTGPVEELRAITVVDFRRLSKDPKEACLKIRDKIDLLAEQSYTRRSEGIVAWTASEVVRTYLGIMREGLNGTPPAEATAARKASGQPYLEPEEFQAVAELSRQLRY